MKTGMIQITPLKEKHFHINPGASKTGIGVLPDLWMVKPSIKKTNRGPQLPVTSRIMLIRLIPGSEKWQ